MSSEIGTVDRFFQITERGSDIQTEIRGGIVTFLAMFYILAVNPIILSSTSDIDFQQLVGATALASGISCILMALYARFPVALAPGMGINAFVSYTVVSAMGFTYHQAMMIVLVSGVLFFAMSVTGMRSKIIQEIPRVIKVSMSVGIGFFIVCVGLFNCGIIVHGNGSALTLGDLGSPGVLLAFFCIILTVALWYKHRWYAILFGSLATVAVGLVGGQYFGWDTVVNGTSLIPGVGTSAVNEIATVPDLGLFGSVFTEFTMFDVPMIPAFVVSIVSLLIVDIFDTTGTLMSIGRSTGIMDDSNEGEISEKALEVDAAATVIGAVAGTSTTTAFVESNTGIAAGARTGLMALVVGLLFLLAMFFAPVFSVITSACTIGALVIVGFMMFSSIKDVDSNDPVTMTTVFTTVIMMVLSGSITDGIAFGILIYIVGMAFTGRARELSKMVVVLGAVFVAYFVLTFSVIPALS
ncbi:MAG: NCS2 family permease [Candidatus Methanomethylophilaceae archaeon]|nr:NCS2 family permease [Candidatus Methanomethylophilaceae archaeon]